MEQTPDLRLQDWLDRIADTEMTPFANLPELELYMDQVITLMHRQYDVLALESDRPLTPSMINNYVKDEVMPRPTQKKYNREHLTVLSLICMLKAEFALPEIKELVANLGRFYDNEQLYTLFCESQSVALRKAADRLAPFAELNEAERYKLAMELALEANAKRIAAAKLLESLTPPPDDTGDDAKEKDKEKEKKDKKEKKEKKKKKDNE